MKLNRDGVSLAVLELVLDIAANQRAMNRVLMTYMAQGNAEHYKELKEALEEEMSKEFALLRARLVRHADIPIDDLLNGLFDV